MPAKLRVVFDCFAAFKFNVLHVDFALVNHESIVVTLQDFKHCKNGEQQKEEIEFYSQQLSSGRSRTSSKPVPSKL